MMKFTFKTLQYQDDAVQNIVKVFEGQEYSDGIKHRHDFGREASHQLKLDLETGLIPEDGLLAYRNNDLTISSDRLLLNVQQIQTDCGLSKSVKIEKPLGAITLDIDMETGTGKTYVYTKTMFELNKTYGWSKFIIVVPSIAIREGVFKSIQTTSDHFMELYGKKLRAFIYSSSNLNKIDEFSQNSGINVMIINSQAFATSLKEGAKSKESRIIYSERDEFATRRPIDIIAANRPILILDEPQKLNGTATQEALRKHFKVLFSMNFSATHAVHHNLIYSLDALDAYNQKLVKKIEVKGVDVNHSDGTNRYIYFESIVLNGKEKPKARLELSVNHLNGIRRETHLVAYQDSLYTHSAGKDAVGIEAYKGLYVTNIDPLTNTISFSDGVILSAGESIGDTSESNKRRIQIRETILSHLNKEEKLFKRGIKVLSLFFIDKVVKYRQYDDNGQPKLGEYGQIFEEEFNTILQSRGHFYDPDYVALLKKYPVSKIHGGYFSIDKKGQLSDGESKKESEESTDATAYERILKHKELLLSNDDPIRFIFSHSALSEGWDNPNVFQICILKHSDYQNASSRRDNRRRQEVGRGMRICVDQHGDRQDYENLGPRFHDVNLLTVVADEDYGVFINGLQSETQDAIRNRLMPITAAFLSKRKVLVESGEINLESMQAEVLYSYLVVNEYLDESHLPTDKLKEDLITNQLAPFPSRLSGIESGIKGLLAKISDPTSVKDMYADARKPKIIGNNLNDNFKKKEFIQLWEEINHQYHYKVSFSSEELIRNAVTRINADLNVVGLSYTIKTGSQRSIITYDQARSKDSFSSPETHTENLDATYHSNVKYDLIGKITSGTGLTRKTISQILQRINDKQFNMFKINPEEFITKITRLINEVKGTSIVDHIIYEPTGKTFDSEIFTIDHLEGDYVSAHKAKKNIQDYVFPDSNQEKLFAEDLDNADEVVVYAKLPDGKKGFYIPTPVGNYSPDWAIAFNKDLVRHLFFVAETKGDMSSLVLDKIEDSKIKCATKLFEQLHKDVKYAKIDNYAHLLDLMRGS